MARSEPEGAYLAMASENSLHCEVEKSDADERGNKVTTIKYHGRLVSATSGQMKEAVRPLIPLGGRIVIDLGDLNYLDSSGVGPLIGLKVSATRQGLCIMELTNMTPRVLELLRVTNLAQMLSS